MRVQTRYAAGTQARRQRTSTPESPPELCPLPPLSVDVTPSPANKGSSEPAVAAPPMPKHHYLRRPARLLAHSTSELRNRSTKAARRATRLQRVIAKPSVRGRFRGARGCVGWAWWIDEFVEDHRRAERRSSWRRPGRLGPERQRAQADGYQQRDQQSRASAHRLRRVRTRRSGRGNVAHGVAPEVAA